MSKVPGAKSFHLDPRESAISSVQSSEPQSSPVAPDVFAGFNDKISLPPEAPPPPEPSTDRRWNYIFTVGRSSSGKSTLQRHLLLYLLKKRHHVVLPASKQGAELQESEDLEREWKNLALEWHDQQMRGEFPQRTTSGKLTDFRFIVKPANGRPELPFGFVEISGEDFKALTQKNDDAITLDSVDRYLTNPDISLTFLFVMRGDDVSYDDILFSRFLDYLDKRRQRTQSIDRCNAAIVLSDPETCIARLNHWRRAQPGIDVPADLSPTAEVEAFVHAFVPQTCTRLETLWRERAAIVQFSVGTVGEVENPDTGEVEKRITRWSYDDAQALYEWLYERFTGKSLGPGPIRKFLDWLRRND